MCRKGVYVFADHGVSAAGIKKDMQMLLGEVHKVIAIAKADYPKRRAFRRFIAFYTRRNLKVAFSPFQRGQAIVKARDRHQGPFWAI
ncbi:protein of unknown function [Serratia sp. Tan611]|nr:protein of unknown function [Serratia sp. Tan611]